MPKTSPSGPPAAAPEPSKSSGDRANRVRLQEPEAAKALAHLIFEHLLDTRLDALLPPEFLAEHLAESLIAADPKALETFLCDRLQAARGLWSEDDHATLQSRLPEGVESPLATLAAESRIPLRETLTPLLDHPAMREVLRAVLIDTLTRFSGKMGSVLGEASKLPGASRLGGVLGMARGVGSVLVDELARKLEGRAAPFVDGALSRAMKIGLDGLTDPDREEAMAGWRRSSVGAVLDLPIGAFATESTRSDPAVIAAAVTELLLRFARWPEAPGHLARLMREVGGDLWALPLSDALRAAGLDPEATRAKLEAELAGRLAPFLASASFGEWLSVHAS